MQNIFITGGTGYIGKRLINALLKKEGYKIFALVRKGSEDKVPQGCELVAGNALDASTYQDKIPTDATFIHLVGFHPGSD